MAVWSKCEKCGCLLKGERKLCEFCKSPRVEDDKDS